MIYVPTQQGITALAAEPIQTDFLQRLETFFQCLTPCLDRRPAYREASLPERLAAPERAVYFSVSFPGDDGRVRTAPCCFIQYTTVLGPARCALSFQPVMDISGMKWRALSLSLENSLTGLAMGGAAAGASIDPAALSQRESLAFCQRFITALAPYLPACAVLEGSLPLREQGYLRGQISRLPYTLPRPSRIFPPQWEQDQARGYGLCYFAQSTLRKSSGPRLEGQTAAIGGNTGPAAWAGEKALQLGAMVTAIGGKNGCLYASAGLPLALLRDMARNPARPLPSYASETAGIVFQPDRSVWDADADIYLPCDPVCPLDKTGAQAAIAHGAAVFEGAESACTPKAVRLLREAGALYVPSVAAACGAALAQSDSQEPGKRLRIGARAVLNRIWEEALSAPRRDLTAASYIAAFEPIAQAMLEQGV
ncbi:MAG: hypothetical protein LUC89_06050 [Oscillospiraceae bacterium]|nr:hypothetical protein [Oscillospiraceae bacterium]